MSVKDCIKASFHCWFPFVVLVILCVSLSTIVAIFWIKPLENKFNNNYVQTTCVIKNCTNVIKCPNNLPQSCTEIFTCDENYCNKTSSCQYVDPNKNGMKKCTIDTSLFINLPDSHTVKQFTSHQYCQHYGLPSNLIQCYYTSNNANESLSLDPIFPNIIGPLLVIVFGCFILIAIAGFTSYRIQKNCV